jgi:hypothetical protein
MTAVRILSKNKRKIFHLYIHGGMSFLMNFIQNVSIIILSRFTPHVDEIIIDQQYGLRYSSSNNDQVSFIRLILEKI